MKIDIDCNIDNKVDITGCNLDIFSMSSSSSEIVSDSLAKLVEAGIPVWLKTDRVGTTFRGSQHNVVNTVKTLCQLSHRPGTETAFELTFSKGCRGDKNADSFSKESTKEWKLADLENFKVVCKYSFYAFGTQDYMQQIQKIVDLADEANLNPQEMHYATKLSGSIEGLFNYFDKALSYAHEHINHYVIEATIFDLPALSV